MSADFKFNDRDLLAAVEKEAKDKLRRAGLSKVRVKVQKERGEAVVKLDADTDEELAKAASVLGIRK